jgi:hypothetical protein
MKFLINKSKGALIIQKLILAGAFVPDEFVSGDDLTE